MKRLLLLALLCPVLAFAQSWTENITYASCNSNVLQNGGDRWRWISVTSVPAGTVSKLRVGLFTVAFDSTGFKIALYDSTGSTLLVSATTVANVADGGAPKEVTVTNTVITAGNYLVAYTANGNAGDLKYSSVSATTGTLSMFGASYAAFPPSSIASTTTYETTSAGVFVTPSAGNTNKGFFDFF